MEGTEFEWTERLLSIPDAVAARHAAPGTWPYDEIRSEAAFMMLRAAKHYRAGRGMSAASYCFRAAKCAAARLALALGGVSPSRRGGGLAGNELRWGLLRSLDAPPAGGERPLGSLLAAAEPQPGESAADAELLAAALSRLPPLRRAAYSMRVGRGVRLAEIAAMIGVSPRTVRDWVSRDTRKLRRYAAAHRSGSAARRARGNLKACPPPRGDNQKAAAARHCREMAKARRLAGDVPRGKFVWYAADDAARTLEGPYDGLKTLLAAKGVEVPGSRAHAKVYADRPALAGLRLVRGPEAPALARDGYRLIERGE